MHKFIYLFIKNFLFARDIGIKHYELFNNQPLDPSHSNPYPAVYLEILPIEWNNLGSQIQQAIATFRLHIVNEIYTSFDADDEKVETSLNHLDILRDIYRALDMRSSDDDRLPQLIDDQSFYRINTMNRIRTISNNQLKSRFITMVDYSASIQDYSNWTYNDYIDFNLTSLSGDTIETGATGVTFKYSGNF